MTAELPAQRDRSGWPLLRAEFTSAFASRSRDEWETIFAGTDACVSPVLSFAEAESEAHLAARGTLVEIDGVVQAAPAPRFSRSTTELQTAPAREAVSTQDVLSDWS